MIKNQYFIDLQAAFAAFLNDILDDSPLAAAVDGKGAKQMKDENGDPILMLNVFAQSRDVIITCRGATSRPTCMNTPV